MEGLIDQESDDDDDEEKEEEEDDSSADVDNDSEDGAQNGTFEEDEEEVEDDISEASRSDFDSEEELNKLLGDEEDPSDYSSVEFPDESQDDLSDVNLKTCQLRIHQLKKSRPNIPMAD